MLRFSGCCKMLHWRCKFLYLKKYFKDLNETWHETSPWVGGYSYQIWSCYSNSKCCCSMLQTINFCSKLFFSAAKNKNVHWNSTYKISHVPCSILLEIWCLQQIIPLLQGAATLPVMTVSFMKVNIHLKLGYLEWLCLFTFSFMSEGAQYACTMRLLQTAVLLMRFCCK